MAQPTRLWRALLRIRVRVLHGIEPASAFLLRARHFRRPIDAQYCAELRTLLSIICRLVPGGIYSPLVPNGLQSLSDG